MPRPEQESKEVIFRKMLSQFDIVQLAGISTQLTKTENIDLNTFNDEKNSKKTIETNLINYILNNEHSSGLNIRIDESRIKECADNSLSKTDFDFVYNKNEPLILMFYIVISNNNEEIKPHSLSVNMEVYFEDIKNRILVSLCTSRIDKNKKIKFIQKIKERYEKSLTNNKFNWLEANNKDQEEWAKEYIQNNETLKQVIKHTPNVFHSDFNFTILIPTIFHALDSGDAEKTLLLINFKKAWSQYKYRRKIAKDNKKTLNIVVDESITLKLKMLSQDFDMPVNKLISIMTEQFFQKSEELKQRANEEKRKKEKKLREMI
ncbi:hypothetical protein RJD40_19260 [Vibrio scophthalmi]|uniref:hypothetical protein n=1 Tax=Vibrio scophthalmi TaxID=45658 RepID=UPI003AB04645